MSSLALSSKQQNVLTLLETSKSHCQACSCSAAIQGRNQGISGFGSKGGNPGIFLPPRREKPARIFPLGALEVADRSTETNRQKQIKHKQSPKTYRPGPSERQMLRWDEMCKDFIRGNACVRETGRELERLRAPSDHKTSLTLSGGERKRPRLLGKTTWDSPSQSQPSQEC